MGYIEAGNATRAYKVAYDADGMQDSTISNEAYKLMKNPDITTRIKELQSQYAELNKVTIESLTRALVAAQELATEQKRPHDMIAATMSKAKLHGLLTKKIETTAKETRTTVEIDAEILKMIEGFGVE